MDVIIIIGGDLLDSCRACSRGSLWRLRLLLVPSDLWADRWLRSLHFLLHQGHLLHLTSRCEYDGELEEEGDQGEQSRQDKQLHPVPSVQDHPDVAQDAHPV